MIVRIKEQLRVSTSHGTAVWKFWVDERLKGHMQIIQMQVLAQEIKNLKSDGCKSIKTSDGMLALTE